MSALLNMPVSLRMVEEAIQHQRRNAIDYIYPAQGPLRRELYRIHQECLRAGSTAHCRYFLGGNRCMTLNSVLETDRGERQCRELIGETGFDVRSWDGSSQCTKRASGIFLRGYEPAYLLGLGNGQVFECSGKHRVLMSSESGARRLSGWVSIDQLIRASSALHWKRTIPSYPANYDKANCLCDEQFHSLADAMASIFERSRACQHSVRRAIRDEAFPREVRSWQTHSDLSFSGISRRLIEISRFLRQPEPGLGPAQAAEQFAPWLREHVEAEILLALKHPRLHDCTVIEYIIPLGFTPIVDIEVEGTHCYSSQGLISHNCGKSRGIGAFETALHATGEYPDWWTGFRIPPSAGAPEIWISGESNEWLRDNAWKELLGPPEDLGTGMIRASKIAHIDRDSSPAGAIGRVWVNHKSGRKSIIGSKTWHEGRDAYSGTKRWFIWCDEEHPADIIQECKMRTMSTVPGEPTGRILCTLTPLDGVTEFIAPLVRDPDTEDRRVFFCGWDDVPHLTEEAKRIMLADMPEMQRASRTKGIPDVGEGQVYPYSEDSITCEPFEIPEHWPRGYGLDTGRKFTAAVFAAWDRDDDVVYIYADHKVANAEVAIHASAIKARGVWMHGVADAAAINFSDGEQIIDLYRREGLNLTLPDKRSVWAAIEAVKSRFKSGRLKIFKTCRETRLELPLYRWQNGKIVKVNDHLMDAMRYLVHSGLPLMKCNPRHLNKPKQPTYPMVSGMNKGLGWMA